MGSYTPPAERFVDFRDLIDATRPTGEIVYTNRFVSFDVFSTGSALYNGSMVVEVQRQTGLWEILAQGTLQNQSNRQSPGIGQISAEFPPLVYPYNMRVRIFAACTLGTLLVYVVGRQGPTNPLF